MMESEEAHLGKQMQEKEKAAQAELAEKRWLRTVAAAVTSSEQ